MKIPFQKHIDKVLSNVPHMVCYTVQAENAQISKVFREFNKKLMWRYGCVPPYDYVWWNMFNKQVVLFGAAPAMLQLFAEHLEHCESLGVISNIKQVIKRGQRKSFQQTLKHYVGCYLPNPYFRAWACSLRA